MYYFCPVCGSDREDPSNWFTEKEIPTHMFRVHNHRMRTMEDFKKDWSMLGIVETRTEKPKKEYENNFKLPKKTY